MHPLQNEKLQLDMEVEPLITEVGKYKYCNLGIQRVAWVQWTVQDADLELADKFYCIGDMMSVDGDAVRLWTRSLDWMEWIKHLTTTVKEKHNEKNMIRLLNKKIDVKAW